MFRSTRVRMCSGEAKEVGAEPADQDSAQEVRLRRSTRSRLDQCHDGLRRPHPAVCPGRGNSCIPWPNCFWARRGLSFSSESTFVLQAGKTQSITTSIWYRQVSPSFLPGKLQHFHFNDSEPLIILTRARFRPVIGVTTALS